MEYKILAVPFVKGVLSVDAMKTAAELTDLVSQHLRTGWRPQGGVTVSDAESSKEYIMMQAVVRAK